MTAIDHRVSIIVTTSRPVDSISTLLEALGQQDYNACLEVVWVGDPKAVGLVSGVAGSPRTSPRLTLSILDSHGAVQGAARNMGVAVASGRWLLFLDSQMVPCRSWVGAHVRALEKNPSGLVIGYVRMSWPDPSDFLNIRLRSLWEQRFEAMRRPFHRFCFEDLFDGNFSLSAEKLKGLDGFDATMVARALPEFAFRWINSGESVCFSSEALAWRPRPELLEQVLAEQKLSGRADALLVRKHSQLKQALPRCNLRKTRPRSKKILKAAVLETAAHLPFLGNLIAQMLILMELLRLRTGWQIIYRHAEMMHYWIGYRGGFKLTAGFAWRMMAAENRIQQGNDLVIDLNEGWAAAEASLDSRRPDGIQLEFDHWPVGRIPSQAGAELLRGVHLRQILENGPSRALVLNMVLKQLDSPENILNFINQHTDGETDNSDTIPAGDSGGAHTTLD